MGLAIRDIVQAKEISIDELKNKALAIDSFNILYQFLTTIRARDGTPLQDSKGHVTSHLVGLFSRTTKLMEKQLRPIFVFDGEPPKLKEAERERRKELKAEAQAKYKIAVAEEDIEEMRKYAARNVHITDKIVEESKELIRALGLPVVQAPSEGEAQAAFIVKQGDAFACVSQDFDSLLHGASRLVRNLSIAGKKKKANKLSYETVKPELIELAALLNNLGIDNDQLTVLAILAGTDYNKGGVKGIGPKKALQLVKHYGRDFNQLFKEVNWSFDFSWEEVFDLIKNMPVGREYSLESGHINEDAVKRILCIEHDFSEERVNSALERLIKQKKQKQQTTLGDF